MLEIELNPFTELQTDRLILRQVEEADAPEIYFLRSDDKVMQFLDKEKCKSLDEALEFIQMIRKATAENEGITWVICPKGEDKIIGNIALWRFDKPNHRAEIGYVLHPDFWNKGIMSEAMNAVLDYGFNTLKLHSVKANINPANHGSRKVLEKQGFVQEAHFKEDYYFRGKFFDSVILSLIDPASQQASTSHSSLPLC
jgi:ribosomal-protein-alanine N-acetyltransferase